MDYIFAFLLGLIPGFLSNIAGGGAGLIAVPSLMALGLSPISAIATTKFGAVGFIAGSGISGHARKLTRYDHAKPLIFIAIITSVIGPLISMKLSQSHVKSLIAFFIILTACVSLASIKKSYISKEVSKSSRRVGYILFFLSSTMGAGFASGMGLLGNYILILLLGFSALETIATTRTIGIIGTIIQLLIFVKGGNIDYALGSLLLVGSFIGGYFGMHFAVKKGNDFVKKAMAVFAVVLVIYTIS